MLKSRKDSNQAPDDDEIRWSINEKAQKHYLDLADQVTIVINTDIEKDDPEKNT